MPLQRPGACACWVQPHNKLWLLCWAAGQIEAIKRVNGLIKKTQGVMEATKKSYTAAVEARNATGEHSWFVPSRQAAA